MIILLSSLQFGSGNIQTIERIRSYMSSYETTLCDVNAFKTSYEFLKYAQNIKTRLIIGLHLYRAGRLLTDCEIPYIMIIGGTDLNETNAEQDDIKKNCLQNAKFCIAFSQLLKEKALNFLPTVNERKIIVQGQAVDIPSTYGQKTLLDVCQQHPSLKPFKESIDGIPLKDLKLFIFAGGIRQVKDPLYLVDIFSNWHDKDKNVHYVIVGPQLDIEYWKQCKTIIKCLDGVWLVPYIPHEDVVCLIRHSIALVNSSLNEGMAVAILEAMAIGTPVMARCNYSNNDLIGDGVNGILFDNQEDFLTKAMELAANVELRQRISCNAKKYIDLHHNTTKESETYDCLIKEIL